MQLLLVANIGDALEHPCRHPEVDIVLNDIATSSNEGSLPILHSEPVEKSPKTTTVFSNSS